MPDDGTIIPISDEQAKLGQEIIKAFSGVAAFIEKALGSAPEDLIGYLGGDWLRFRRAENIAKMMKLSKEKLEARGVKDQKPASLTITLPILRGAADESRETLQDLWARLLAATIDPSRVDGVRQGFASAISKMDPPDALLLGYFKTINIGVITIDARDQTVRALGISLDELTISFDNLDKLGLVVINKTIQTVYITPFGREFLRVVSD